MNALRKSPPFPNITIDYSILSKREETCEEPDHQEKTEDCAPTQSSAIFNQQPCHFADDWNGESQLHINTPGIRLIFGLLAAF